MTAKADMFLAPGWEWDASHNELNDHKSDKRGSRLPVLQEHEQVSVQLMQPIAAGASPSPRPN